MRYRQACTCDSEGGFSLIELLSVVAIIAVMAAVAIPAISRFVVNYQIRGAATEVTREIDRARTKAISSNANRGVLFVIVDHNSYRVVREDLLPGEELFAPLVDLPGTLQFVAQGSSASQIRFNRLGASCEAGVSPCAPVRAPADLCSAAEVGAGRCGDAPTPGTSYINVSAGTMTITIEDQVRPGLRRTIRISPGGRSYVQG
jgi:prepilin-type N-terminal cleavage/methylation domain-containing protein